jgi:hypothetical protein
MKEFLFLTFSAQSAVSPSRQWRPLDTDDLVCFYDHKTHSMVIGFLGYLNDFQELI